MNIFKSIFFLVSIIFSFQTLANDFAIEVGVKQHSIDASSSTTFVASGMGLQFGGTAHFHISDKLYFRTGMLYTQRPFTATISGTDYKINSNYLDVPAAVMLKFEDYASVFVGMHLALNIDSSASPTITGLNPKSPLTPFIFGFNFKVAPQIGGTLYYETASGDVLQGYSNSRSVGANIMFSFE